MSGPCVPVCAEHPKAGRRAVYLRKPAHHPAATPILPDPAGAGRETRRGPVGRPAGDGSTTPTVTVDGRWA